jgi:putative effector of murein hydrolase
MPAHGKQQKQSMPQILFSALIFFLYKVTMQRTFENVCVLPAAMSPSVIGSFSKILNEVTLYRKYTEARTFEKLCVLPAVSALVCFLCKATTTLEEDSWKMIGGAIIFLSAVSILDVCLFNRDPERFSSLILY